MPKRFCAAGLLLAAALCPAGCRYLLRKTAVPPPTPNPTPAAGLTSLYFSGYGSYFRRLQGYRFRAEAGQHTVYFCIDFTPADGTQVQAAGYSGFPAGYGDASAAIDVHFMQLLPEDMRDW